MLNPEFSIGPYLQCLDHGMVWPYLLEDIQTWAPLITALAALEAASCYDPTSESWPCSLKLYGETTRIYVSLERHANYDAINDIIWYYHTWENMEDSITVHIIYLEIKWNECNLNGKRADYLEVRVALPCPNSPNQLKVCGLYCDTGLSNGYFTKKKHRKAEHLPLWFMPFMISMIRYAVSM